jgi:hypothetical protein
LDRELTLEEMGTLQSHPGGTVGIPLFFRTGHLFPYVMTNGIAVTFNRCVAPSEISRLLKRHGYRIDQNYPAAKLVFAKRTSAANDWALSIANRIIEEDPKGVVLASSPLLSNCANIDP